LRRAALWDEVKDHLHKSAYELSGGSNSACVSRGALPLSLKCFCWTNRAPPRPDQHSKIEELLVQLKDSCTIAIVTHNMQQAARVSDYTAFLLVASWWNLTRRAMLPHRAIHARRRISPAVSDETRSKTR